MSEVTKRELLAQLEVVEKEKEELKNCLNSVARYEKEKYDFELQLAKDILHRDAKPVANVILNMRFGHAHVSFCEIFELNKEGRCVEGLRCTDCIHAWLQKYFQEKGDEYEQTATEKE